MSFRPARWASVARLVLALAAPAVAAAQPADPRTDWPSAWRLHALRDLIPFWLVPAARGEPEGAFPTWRHNDGSAYTPDRLRPEFFRLSEAERAETRRLYTRMQAQQTYAYAAAFHLTGDPELLRLARAGVEWLRRQAFEPVTGSVVSWFEDGAPAGPPPLARTSQDLAWAAAGLAMLHHVTRDPALLADLRTIKEHVFARYHDPERDILRWTASGPAAVERLELVAPLDQIHGYLLLTAPLLPEPQRTVWRADLGRTAAMVREHFYDPETGRFLGTRGAPDSMSWNGRNNDFGHTVRAFRLLHLAGRLLGDNALAEFGAAGGAHVVELAWLPEDGSWGSRLLAHGGVDRHKPWNIFCELNQMAGLLTLAGRWDRRDLERAWDYWLEKFVDRKHGEVFTLVRPDGSVREDALKVHAWKNGFHSLEHALFNYLVACGLEDRPATLFFALPADRADAAVRPYLLEAEEVSRTAEFVDGVLRQRVEFRLRR